MGLIKAAISSFGGTMADQWKEYFYCDSMSNDLLVTRGHKVTGKRSSNTKGHDNVISNGSGIAVADGQCMLIVEHGKVVEICAEPGCFTYDTSSEPSLFTGPLGTGILETFKTVGKRFTYGGDVGNDQRVYYINTKELFDNKFGTPNPVPFRVVDHKINLDIDVSIRCSGVYSYQIENPPLFYVKVCNNVTDRFTRETNGLDSMLKGEFIGALQQAFGKLSALELRPNEIITHNEELQKAMSEELSKLWKERGLKMVSVALGSVTLPPEDAELIKQAQRSAFMSNPGMAAGTLVGAQADAMKAAASNRNGAMNGFLGMGMAMNAGGGTVQNLFAQQAAQQQAAMQAAQQAPQQQNTWKCSCGTIVSGKFCQNCGSKKPEPVQADSWKCSCGTIATGRFCPQCGARRPEVSGWTCSCGSVNQGKFCQNCGARKPADAPLYRCDKCGWQPEDPTHPPKFCPECGDPFDDSDKE